MSGNSFRRKRRRENGPNAGQFGTNRAPPETQTAVEEDDSHEDSPVEEIHRHIWSLARDKPGANQTPGRLRPEPADPTEMDKLVVATSHEMESLVREQRLFDVPLLMTLINNFLSHHSQENPNCSPHCAMPASGETQYGFVFEESLTSVRRVTAVPWQDQGAKACQKNVRFAVALTKLGIGVTGAKTLLSGMDIRTPSISTMQKLVNSVCDSMETILETSLEENRGKLRQVLKLRGTEVREGEPVKITAMTDGCYNNPCYHGVSQRATQVTMPFFETETDENLLIHFKSANKLCQVGEGRREDGEENPCPGHEGHCSSTFDPAEPIGNAERVLAKKAALDLLGGQHPLVLSELETYDTLKERYHALRGTTADRDPGIRDGDARPSSSSTQGEGPSEERVLGGDIWEEGVTVKKEDYTVHVSRGQRKVVFKLQLISQVILGRPLPSGYKKSAARDKKVRFCHVLSHALSRRCQTELSQARALHPTEEDKFLNAVTEAKNNILDCFSGNHSKCKRVSFACKARPNDPSYKPRHLPWGQSLCMTPGDREELIKAIEYRLSPEMVKRQRNLRSINICEAHHLRTLKSLPKSRTQKRNMAGKAASAAHSAAVGGPGMQFLSSADRKAKADKLRQRGLAFKGARAASRWRREKRKKGAAGYKTEHVHPNFSKEHCYSEKKD
ncbi:lens induction in camera-type eye [Branchiostoma belcheri]|nr:lens induction in camera-type eye [Branchiostoma belcheri]